MSDFNKFKDGFLRSVGIDPKRLDLPEDPEGAEIFNSLNAKDQRKVKVGLALLHLQVPDEVRYELLTNHLDETETGKVAVAHDILQLQAEYGYDANANGAIDEEAEWTASLTPGATRWEQILAVRIAVLMRIPHYEKDKVTNSAPRWANGTKEFSMEAGDEWKHYRYRVYESIVPLRNTLWGQQL